MNKDTRNNGRTHRTDPTGRWSPIVEPEKDYPAWGLWVVGACFVLIFALGLTGGM